MWHAIIRGWVQHLDPARFELHLFHTGQIRDTETEWAARHAKTFHHRLGDWAAWAKAVSDSQLDVLVYPEIGMDATTVRLSALRLARRQLAAWGHPITTGLPTIDGFVSAVAFEPGNAAQHYTEQLFALPHLGCSYKSFGVKASRVELAAWGVRPEDRILVCAGTPFKYAPEDDVTLIDIARRCAPCKIIFFVGKPESLALLLKARLRQAFVAAQMDFDECVRFIPWQSQADFFGVLNRADVYLDSIGFSGFNTTMQAIEMATPVVAWDGEFMRGRFASGILSEAGLGEWVANSSENYVEKVARICEDKETRDQYKRQIVLQRGVLFDDRKAVNALGALLLERS